MGEFCPSKPSLAEVVPAKYVRGCKNVGMPIEPLDLTRGTPPPLSGSITFSTATQVEVSGSELKFADTSDVV